MMLQRHRHLLPLVSLLVVWVVWGSTYLAIRVVVREMPPLAAASLRFFVAGAGMLTVAPFMGRRPRPPRLRPGAGPPPLGGGVPRAGEPLRVWGGRARPPRPRGLLPAP